MELLPIGSVVQGKKLKFCKSDIPTSIQTTEMYGDIMLYHALQAFITARV